MLCWGSGKGGVKRFRLIKGIDRLGKRAVDRRLEDPPKRNSFIHLFE